MPGSRLCLLQIPAFRQALAHAGQDAWDTSTSRRPGSLHRRLALVRPALTVDLILVLIVLIGLCLRWSLNGTWRLGPDEALYGTWARHIASSTDVWLAATPGVDKPPLHIYAIAGAMAFYGYTEFATRFPSIIASTVTILLTYLLTRWLYSDVHMARLAALLLALSPFAVLYAPTAYADSLMVMWLLLAAVLASYGRWSMAGVAAGLAIVTKQEAPLFVPPIIVLGLVAQLSRGSSLQMVRTALRRPLLTLVTCSMTVVTVERLWEAQRPGQPSPFSLGLANYGGMRLVALHDIIPRLLSWWQAALRYAFASPLLNLLLIVGSGVLVALVRDEKRHADGMVMAGIGYVLLARTLLSFQVWDRYMLIVVPLFCLLMARIVDWVCDVLGHTRPGHLLAAPSGNAHTQGFAAGIGRWSVGFRRLAQNWASRSLLLIAVLMLVPVNDALAGRIPVGSDHGLYWGIEQTAQFVRDNVPPGSVIYHHSLGWQFGYYLYGVHVDFWWYPSLEWLAETAASRAEHSQYVVVPAWESAQEMADVLAANGLHLLTVHIATRPDGSVSFRTYRIAPVGGQQEGGLHSSERAAKCMYHSEEQA